MFTELETDRLYLRNISLKDRGFIFKQFSCEKVTQYLFDVEPLTSIQDADKIIAFYVKPEPRLQHRWVIVEKESGATIGTCGFHVWDRKENCCDVGYDLYPDFWHKGYMSEAMKSILAFAKENMNVQRIDARIFPNNRSSVKLAEKLGFIFLGQTKDEVFCGEKYLHKIYSLNLAAE